jgi:6-phosphofructokinase 2
LNAIASLQPFEYLVISGSLPEGLASDFIEQLLAIAHEKGARSVLDTSGAALEQAVKSGGLYLIKPSLSELGHLVGEEITQPDQLARITGNLIDNGQCETLMVSMGAQGALLATRDKLERLHAPNVKKISTVGAGDSLLGAMLLKLSEGASVSEAARYGVAAGSASIMRSGTGLCGKADTDQLYAWMQQNHAPLPP